MTPEEQPAGPGAAAPTPPQRPDSGPRRRGFRPPRRPPRREPRGQPPQSAQSKPSPDTTEPGAELPAADIADTGEPMPAHAPEDTGEHGARSAPAGEFRPVASESSRGRAEAGPAIRESIEQLLRINRDLELLLLEMQKALEILEEAEVQKYADERDIESLRAALRNLNRTREGLQRPPQSAPRQEQRPRQPQQREQRFQSSHRQRSGGGGRPPERNPEPAPPAEHSSAEAPPPEESRPERPHEPEIPF